MENNKTFRISNLEFGYNEKKILNGVNCSIPQGKITTFMGANGCGKSTLLSLLTKNNGYTNGTINLNNQKIEDISIKDFAKQVAIVHQINTAPPDLTVEEVVRFGRTPYESQFPTQAQCEASEKAVKKALKICQLYNLKDRCMSDLSGGQRQRVFIAMAIAQETPILILDEPTTYLDVKHQIYILKLVRMLNKINNTTIIMVLHDINQALSYSDEIIALSTKGKILAQGKPEEVITSDLIKDVYDIELDLIEVNGKPFVIAV